MGKTAFAPGALALAALAAMAAPAVAAPVTFAIDSEHTFVGFSYSHHGLSTQRSRFDDVRGTVTLDIEAKTASADITVNMASVHSGSADFDTHLRASDLLDAARYPVATFKSTGAVFRDDRPVRLEGHLTIKGVTHPVTFNITHLALKEHPRVKKPAIGANATAVIRRSEFGAGAHTPSVGDEVTLHIALEAISR